MDVYYNKLISYILYLISTYISGLPVRSSMNDASCATIGQTLRYHQSSLTAYDRHKMLMNQYLLYHPGAPQLLKRDTSVGWAVAVHS